jgi:hypothetical protein
MASSTLCKSGHLVGYPAGGGPHPVIDEHALDH